MTEPDDPTPALKWSDLFGIDPDYTDGVPADEWLAANRGGQARTDTEHATAAAKAGGPTQGDAA